MNRVFGIGLGKTGTRSLHVALIHLGLRSIHDSYLVARLLDHGERPLAAIADYYDAFVDYPIPWAFERLDKAYPGSKFIYTVRDLDSWLESKRCHVARRPRFVTPRTYLPHELVFHRKQEIERYHQHRRMVENYFRARPDDVLTLRICDGEGWEKLCPFLDRPIPDISFPWENRKPES